MILNNTNRQTHNSVLVLKTITTLVSIAIAICIYELARSNDYIIYITHAINVYVISIVVMKTIDYMFRLIPKPVRYN